MQQPPPYAPPGGAPPPAAMVSKVEMTISCQGLRDADVFSKSDPICVLYNLEGNRKREVSVANKQWSRQIFLIASREVL